MNRFTTLLIYSLVLAIVAIVGVVVYVKTTGLDARQTPGALETSIARSLRRLAVPSELRGKANPVPDTPEVLAKARADFANHCAICHGNDGSGDTVMGRGLFPKAPDMRVAATQELTDGELLYIIEYGVRFSGMPGWGDGSPASEEVGWRLVRFVRHLPKLTPEEVSEMEELNPK